MNRNLSTDSDEKNIRKLFAETRAVDEQNIPAFSAVLQCSSNVENTVRIGPLLAIFMAMVILISGFVAAVVYFRKPAPQIVNSNENKKQQMTNDQPLPIEPEKTTPPAPRRIVYRPQKKAPRRTDLMISQWRSPTDFLLRTPGNEFLKTVPRLNDSRLKINSAMPNDLN